MEIQEMKEEHMDSSEPAEDPSNTHQEILPPTMGDNSKNVVEALENYTEVLNAAFEGCNSSTSMEEKPTMAEKVKLEASLEEEEDAEVEPSAEAAACKTHDADSEETNSTIPQPELKASASDTEEETSTADDDVVAEAADDSHEEEEPEEAVNDAIVEPTVLMDAPTDEATDEATDTDTDETANGVPVEPTNEIQEQEPLVEDKGDESTPETEPTEDDNSATEVGNSSGDLVNSATTVESTITAATISKETDLVMEEMEEAMSTAESLSADEEECESIHSNGENPILETSPPPSEDHHVDPPKESVMEEQQQVSEIEKEDLIDSPEQKEEAVESKKETEIESEGTEEPTEEPSPKDEDVGPEETDNAPLATKSDDIADAKLVADDPEEPLSIEVELLGDERVEDAETSAASGKEETRDVEALDNTKELDSTNETTVATPTSVEKDLNDGDSASSKPDPDGAKHDNGASGMSIKEREKLLIAAARKKQHEPPATPNDATAHGKGNIIKEREAMLMADAKKKQKEPVAAVPGTGTMGKGNIVKEREEMLMAAARQKSGDPETSDTPNAAGKGKIIKEREEMLKAAARRSSRGSKDLPTPKSDTPKGNVIKEREEMLKADLQKNSNKGRRASDSFGSRYKNGMAGGLSLETEFNSFHGVKNQISAINDRGETKPPMHSSATTPASADAAKSRSRRASTGEVLSGSKVNAAKANLSASMAAQRRPSPGVNKQATKSLLKTYNPDLYYANEFNCLIDVDPADKSNNKKEIDFAEVMNIITARPSVCAAKYDLTFNGEKLKLYPLFSLVANKAPVEVVQAVFMENPFRLLDVYDESGQTLMHYACMYNPLSTQTLEFLEKRSSHTLNAWDNKNRAPLHTACANLSSETEHVLFILEHSQPEVVATPDNDGKLPLDLAMMNPKCSNAVKKALREKSKGASPVAKEVPKPIPEPVNRSSPTVKISSHSVDKAAVSASPELAYKRSTETVGPQSWWEKFCCVPRI